MKRNVLSALLFLSLFSSVGFTSPSYLDCQDPEPDEWSDFFGKPNSLTTLKVIPETQPVSWSDFIPGDNMFRVHRALHLHLQPFISVPNLSGPLRC